MTMRKKSYEFEIDIFSKIKKKLPTVIRAILKSTCIYIDV